MTKRIFAALKTVQQEFLGNEESWSSEESEFLYAELDRQCTQLAGELWDKATAEAGGLSGAAAVTQALSAQWEAEDHVIATRIIGVLGPRAVHEARYARLYDGTDIGKPLDDSQTTAAAENTRNGRRRAETVGVEVELLGNPEQYVGSDPIEDVALAPDIPWGDADHKAMLDEAIASLGLGPGQWIELEWPPEAGLWTAGHLSVRANSGEETVEEPAQWKWLTTLRIKQLEFRADGAVAERDVYCDPAYEVATTTQHPRTVLIGPPGFS